jgi:hypothetical protein
VAESLFEHLSELELAAEAARILRALLVPRLLALAGLVLALTVVHALPWVAFDTMSAVVAVLVVVAVEAERRARARVRQAAAGIGLTRQRRSDTPPTAR